MEVNSVKGSPALCGPLRGCHGLKELLVVACSVDECDFPKNSTVYVSFFLCLSFSFFFSSEYKTAFTQLHTGTGVQGAFDGLSS